MKDKVYRKIIKIFVKIERRGDKPKQRGVRAGLGDVRHDADF